MAKHDQTWLYFALVITISIHISMITPLSKWFDRILLPLLTDENITIELTEILPKDEPEKLPEIKLIPPKLLIIPPKPEKIPEPIPPPKVKPEPPPKVEPEPSPIIEPEPPPIIEPKPLPELSAIEPPPKVIENKKILSEDLEEDIILTPDISRLEPQKAVPAPPLESKKVPLEDIESIKAPLTEDTKQEPSKQTETDDQALSEEVSPLRIRRDDSEDNTAKETTPKIEIPEEVKQTFRGDKPEETGDEKLQYSLNTYKWTFQRFMENWAVDLQKWWKVPLDYAYGEVPEGGDVWVAVRLSPIGRLLGYKIYKSNVTAEMELKVVQALVGSLQRPELPESFTDMELIVNWRFIYPPIRPEIRLRR